MTSQNNNPKTAVINYHIGFKTNNPDLVLSTLGEQFFMANGNFSGEPTEWQAHMYLTGADLAAWPGMFLAEAGPYENEVEFLKVDIRGNAAVVVTKDNGRNRFRSWQNEIVTWFLGKHDGVWKIVGMFIRDIRNPE